MTPTDDIKQRLDLVEFVQGYVKLTPAGTNWKARCPFHTEKTPSFMVSRDKQIWHCFGCGRGGDHFSFVQEIEGMEFPEALRFLAERAGVEMKREDPELRSHKTRALEVNAFAANVYHRILLEHEKAQPARDYCAKRGLSDNTIRNWLIGYAPESWEGVSQFLKKRGLTDDEIFHAGLTIKRDRGTGYYDRFRHRIMFPVHDHLGRIVGFGGRAIDEQQGPKYMNTPQTAVYDKSALLYGFAKAKSAIKVAKRAVIVEGYMDVLSSHQAGITNVVASSGTALTRQQIRIVKRLTDTVALAFDTDIAGQAAAERGIDVAWEEGMNVLVVAQLSGKDPDELIRKGPALWRTATDEAVPFLEHLLSQAKRTLDLSSVAGKKQAAKTMLSWLARLHDPIEQTHYLQELSALIRVPEDVLRSRLPSPKPAEKRGSVPETPTPSQRGKSRAQVLAERVLALGVQNEAHLAYLIDHLDPADLAQTNLLGLYKALVTYYTENHRLDQRDFLQALGREDQALAKVATIIFLLGTSDLLPADERLQKRELLEGLTALRKLAVQEELKRLQNAVAEAERRGARDELRTLTEKVSDLTKQLAEFHE